MLAFLAELYISGCRCQHFSLRLIVWVQLTQPRYAVTQALASIAILSFSFIFLFNPFPVAYLKSQDCMCGGVCHLYGSIQYIDAFIFCNVPHLMKCLGIAIHSTQSALGSVIHIACASYFATWVVPFYASSISPCLFHFPALQVIIKIYIMQQGSSFCLVLLTVMNMSENYVGLPV